MFSRQHTRQLSASPPPPFSYASHVPYGFSGAHSVPQVVPLSPPYLSSDYPQYPAYLSPLVQSSQSQSKPITVQQGLYGEDEMSPFSMSLASLAGSGDAYFRGGYSDRSMIQVRPCPSRLSHSVPHPRLQAGADGPS